MIADEMPPLRTRHLYTTPVAAVDAADAINFCLLYPVEPLVICRCADPFLCIWPYPRSRQALLERAKRRLSSGCFVGAYQTLDRLVDLRRRFPVRLTPVNGLQCLLHPANTERQPCLLRGRDGLPSAEDADLTAAARPAAADEDGAAAGAFGDPLSAIGIACGNTRLVDAEAGLQSQGEGQRTEFERYRRISVA